MRTAWMLSGPKFLWDALCAGVGLLGRLGDETTFVKPDRRPRLHTPCRCPSCGFTQLVGGPADLIHGVSQMRFCASCGDPVSATEDAIGPQEICS